LRASNRCSAVGYSSPSYSTSCGEECNSPENSPYPLTLITEGMVAGVCTGPPLLSADDGTDIAPPVKGVWLPPQTADDGTVIVPPPIIGLGPPLLTADDGTDKVPAPVMDVGKGRGLEVPGAVDTCIV
jgi:hypothetical protein